MIKKELIKISLNLDNYGLTKNRTHYAYYKNKVCGDKIEIELNVDKIKINTMRYETESCIYCQASASILSKIISSLSSALIMISLRFSVFDLPSLSTISLDSFSSSSLISESTL